MHQLVALHGRPVRDHVVASVDQRREPRGAVGIENVVGVEEPDQPPSGRCDARIARCGCSSVLDSDHSQPRIGDSGQKLGNGFRAAVVDDDHLHRDASLVESAHDRLVQPLGLRPPCGHGECHLRCHVSNSVTVTSPYPRSNSSGTRAATALTVA